MRIKRHALPVRFLLIFALLFSQMGGLFHGISHAFAQQSEHQSLPHDKPCGLCDAYAQLGSALGSHAVEFVQAEQISSLADSPFISLHSSIPFAAFSARAPPRSA